jgi:hypothetical protein
MRTLASIAGFLLTVVAAILIGFGVPVAWVWIGSQLQGDSGATSTNFSVAMAILFGIIFSYVLLLYLAGIVMALFDGSERGGGSQPPRAPWMRGMTDTRQLQRNSHSSVERVFVVTTIIVTVAFWAWFAFKAGSPLPNQ